jgi:hypothetical protein
LTPSGVSSNAQANINRKREANGYYEDYRLEYPVGRAERWKHDFADLKDDPANDDVGDTHANDIAPFQLVEEFSHNPCPGAQQSGQTINPGKQ